MKIKDLSGMIAFIVSLALLTPGYTFGARVCVSIDGDGNTVYSDRAGKGKKKKCRGPAIVQDVDPEPEPEPEPDPPASPSEVMAFPGAEGFGAMSTGGRGGAVHIVSNLNDSGSGSLRSAVGQSGPRTIVFAVSGEINLSSQLSIDYPNITIAGQTSPAGVTLKGARIKVRTHDVIIRGLRVRPGDDSYGMSPENRDGLSIGDNNGSVYNVIVDHSSFTWAVDENGSNWFPNNNITIQWSIFAEGLKDSIHPEGHHSMGYLVGADSQKISMHHNIFANNEHRNPVVSDSRSVEIINNVGYNWRSEGLAVGSSGNTTLHAINNFYAHGPNTTVRPAFYLRSSELGQHQIYLDGNIDSRYRPSVSTGDEWDVAHGWDASMRASGHVFEASGITTDDTQTAFSKVMDSAGAISPSRDAIDARIINGILTNSGAIIDSPDVVGGYLTPGNVESTVDTDQDGMPDSWEIQHELDPSDASDRNDDHDSDGYTELEEYLNSLI